MQPFDYYKNIATVYPNRKDYNRYNVYQGDKCLGQNLTVGQLVQVEAVQKLVILSRVSMPEQVSELIACALKSNIFIVKFFDDDGFNSHRQEYKDEQARLLNEFKADLFEEFDVTTNSKAELAFEKAWERGHDCGYHEVYGEFADLVDLIT